MSAHWLLMNASGLLAQDRPEGRQSRLKFVELVGDVPSEQTLSDWVEEFQVVVEVHLLALVARLVASVPLIRGWQAFYLIAQVPIDMESLCLLPC